VGLSEGQEGRATLKRGLVMIRRRLRQTMGPVGRGFGGKQARRYWPVSGIRAKGLGGTITREGEKEGAEKKRHQNQL